MWRPQDDPGEGSSKHHESNNHNNVPGDNDSDSNGKGKSKQSPHRVCGHCGHSLNGDQRSADASGRPPLHSSIKREGTRYYSSKGHDGSDDEYLSLPNVHFEDGNRPGERDSPVEARYIPQPPPAPYNPPTSWERIINTPPPAPEPDSAPYLGEYHRARAAHGYPASEYTESNAGSVDSRDDSDHEMDHNRFSPSRRGSSSRIKDKVKALMGGSRSRVDLGLGSDFEKNRSSGNPKAIASPGPFHFGEGPEDSHYGPASWAGALAGFIIGRQLGHGDFIATTTGTLLGLLGGGMAEHVNTNKKRYVREFKSKTGHRGQDSRR